MAKRKELLAAGIIRDIRFPNPDDAQRYIITLDHKKVDYKILDTCLTNNGTVIIRVVEQYNNTPLIQLYEE